VQINCSHDFNKRFLFVVVVVAIVAIVAFAFASTFVLFSIVLASTFVSLALTFVSFALTLTLFVLLISLSLIVILLALFALLNLFLGRNIERICELKKIKTKLTIYNSCLMLLLRICS